MLIAAFEEDSEEDAEENHREVPHGEEHGCLHGTPNQTTTRPTSPPITTKPTNPYTIWYAILTLIIPQESALTPFPPPPALIPNSPLGQTPINARTGTVTHQQSPRVPVPDFLENVQGVTVGHTKQQGELCETSEFLQI